MSRTTKTVRSPKDKYFTPQPIIDLAVERVLRRPWDIVIDVGSGDGRIIETMQQALVYDCQLHAIEPFYPYMPEEGIDFFPVEFQDYYPGRFYTRGDRRLIMSNPPYSMLNDIFLDMVDIIETGDPGSVLALLLRLDYLGGKDRTKLGFYDTKLDFVNEFVLSPRAKFNNSSGGDSGEYAWVCWEKPMPALGRTHESWLWKETK